MYNTNRKTNSLNRIPQTGNYINNKSTQTINNHQRHRRKLTTKQSKHKSNKTSKTNKTPPTNPLKASIKHKLTNHINQTSPQPQTLMLKQPLTKQFTQPKNFQSKPSNVKSTKHTTRNLSLTINKNTNSIKSKMVQIQSHNIQTHYLKQHQTNHHNQASPI